MINWGNVPVGAVLPFVFGSYDGATGASEAITGLAVTDIEIYKGVSMTQRASDAGVVLLDTDGIDIDTHVGVNGFSIDTGDDTDAGFYAAGSFYVVVVASITVDGQTVNFVAGIFRLVPAEASAGIPDVNAVLVNDATPDTKDDIANEVLTEVVADHSGTAGSLAAVVAAINTATGTTIPGVLGTPADTDLATDLANIQTAADAVETDTQDIQARLPAALVSGRMSSDAVALSGSTTAADQLEAGALSSVLVTIGTGSTTTAIETNLTEATNDHYNGRTLAFRTGACAGQATTISDYVGATKVLTVVALTDAPANGDLAVII